MITIETLSYNYGCQKVLDSINLKPEEDKTTVLIGPSGCGKSTLLKAIIGLIKPDTGKIIINDCLLTPKTAQGLRHQMGYVIQDGGLFPHLTAEENVTLLARFLGKAKTVIYNRLDELTQLVHLSKFLLSRYPVELSGGQRQRIGLMRALMLDPQVLLLDEPLGALDPITRSQLQIELKNIFTELGKTVIFVTHDMAEAAYFSDSIALMREGKIVQEGTLDDLLKRPAQDYVTEFLHSQRRFPFTM